MNLYAESSAVAAWLLGESEGSRVATLLTQAHIIIASDLTLIECARVLIRAVARAEMSEIAAADFLRESDTKSSDWGIQRIAPDIVQRARQPFPAEPIRSLDAIHLASALAARAATPDIEILSLDNRIRTARQLGFIVQPR